MRSEADRIGLQTRAWRMTPHGCSRYTATRAARSRLVIGSVLRRRCGVRHRLGRPRHLSHGPELVAARDDLRGFSGDPSTTSIGSGSRVARQRPTESGSRPFEGQTSPEGPPPVDANAVYIPLDRGGPARHGDGAAPRAPCGPSGRSSARLEVASDQKPTPPTKRSRGRRRSRRAQPGSQRARPRTISTDSACISPMISSSSTTRRGRGLVARTRQPRRRARCVRAARAQVETTLATGRAGQGEVGRRLTMIPNASAGRFGNRDRRVV